MRGRIKAVICLILTVTIAFFGGCTSSRNLNELVIVMGIGMDKDEGNPQNVKITAQIVLPAKISTPGKGSSPSENPYSNLSSTAKSTFEAVREYTHMVSGKLYIAHTQVYVIGRELAEQGIAPRLDFFIRANETRPTSKIVISDTTADDVLNVKPNLNTLPATNITKLVEAQVANSQSIDATLLDYINAMQSSTTSFMAPLVQIREREGEKIVAISGMAVFKEDRMVGQFSENEARGVLWVKGKVQSTVINVDILGGNASLEVLSAKGKVSPVVSGDHVTMKIDVSVSTELSEQSCTENLATEENMKTLQELIKAAICDDIAMAYTKAVTLNADVFGFGDTVHEHYDKEWETLQPRWDELFRSLTLEVHVDATVVSTGSLEQPVWTKEEERP